MEAGLDSLGAVELRNTLQQTFAIGLPATLTFDYPTTAALAGRIAELLQTGAHAEDQQPSATPLLSLSDIQTAIDDIVARMLGPGVLPDQASSQAFPQPVL